MTKNEQSKSNELTNNNWKGYISESYNSFVTEAWQMASDARSGASELFSDIISK